MLEGRSRYRMLPSLVTPATLGPKSFSSKYLDKTCKTFFYTLFLTNELFCVFVFVFCILFEKTNDIYPPTEEQ